MAVSIDIPSIRIQMESAMREIPLADGWTISVGTPDNEGRQGIRVSNEESPPHRVIFYVHGGAFVLGSAKMYGSFVSHLCEAAGVAANIPNYRLAPEHRFPSALDDITAAYLDLLNGRTSPPSIALVADSAGAALALGLLERIRVADDDIAAPDAMVLMSPWLDLSLSGGSVETKRGIDDLDATTLEYFATEYLGDVRPDDPNASPLFADLTNMPACYVTVGSNEILLDDAVRFAERNRTGPDDVSLEIFEGRPHNFQLALSNDPLARRAVANIGSFLEDHLSNG